MHFINKLEQNEHVFRFNYPPLLLSYAGSGNTLTRLIIEYITNIWTGSVYNDSTLTEIGFLGESHCVDVSVVKAHPEHLIPNWNSKRKTRKKDILIQPCLWKWKRTQLQTTAHYINNNTNTFQNMSAIFIIRNPYRAIFSKYMLKYGKKGTGMISKHTSQLPLKHWRTNLFCNHMREGQEQWYQEIQLMDRMTELNHEYVTVKFENLTDLEQPEVAINEMRKIVNEMRM